jgi:hypothetical protein
MRPEDYRRQMERRLRWRLAFRLAGWALLLAALAVVAWVAV